MTTQNLANKATILARIREAMSIPSDHEVREKSLGGEGARHATDRIEDAAQARARRDCLPQSGNNLEQRLELFAMHARNLRAGFHPFASLAEAWPVLDQMKHEENWQRVGAHHHPTVDDVCRRLELPVCWTDESYDRRALESCDVGITTCECLIAQTGSVHVTSRGNGGRALSVLPPHHVVLATRQQLVPDLAASFAILRERYGATFPSMSSLITGPSRTGDIERILVLGAHGPKRLTIFLVG